MVPITSLLLPKNLAPFAPIGFDEVRQEEEEDILKRVTTRDSRRRVVEQELKESLSLSEPGVSRVPLESSWCERLPPLCRDESLEHVFGTSSSHLITRCARRALARPSCQLRLTRQHGELAAMHRCARRRGLGTSEVLPAEGSGAQRELM